MTNPKPKVIFFDAVGTLFGIRGTVGQIYGEIAKSFGVEVAPNLLDRSFRESFRQAPVAAFPHATPREIPRLEFEWWERVASHTFQKAGVYSQFPDFSKFFAELYAYFATSQPWVVYPEVLPTLERCQSAGIELGVLSNFDSRLYAVLKALDLNHFFQSVTISTEVGAAKPDPQIFATALAKHNSLPQEAWHVGDSRQDDYEGANAAGLRGYWLTRS